MELPGPPALRAPLALAAAADLISAFARAWAREGLGPNFLGTMGPAAQETGLKRGLLLLVPFPSWAQPQMARGVTVQLGLSLHTSWVAPGVVELEWVPGS